MNWRPRFSKAEGKFQTNIHFTPIGDKLVQVLKMQKSGFKFNFKSVLSDPLLPIEVNMQFQPTHINIEAAAARQASSA